MSWTEINYHAPAAAALDYLPHLVSYVVLLQVRVIRAGREQRISCFDLVVGDIVVVETGDILAADGILFAGGELRWAQDDSSSSSTTVVCVSATGMQT